MAAPVLTPEDVREHIKDKAEANHLLDGVEFDNTRIDLAMQVAMDKFNMIIPISMVNIYTFPNKTLLMYGTIASLFEGQCALLARNHMSYSDGGINIPIEERMQLYQSLAVAYGQSFDMSSRAIKLQRNIEDGWGIVDSDYARMPIW
jgi:hypothetical protein